MAEMKLIGLESFRSAVDTICNHAEIYRLCGAPVLVLDLPPGSGQTTAARYLVQRAEESSLLPFSSPEHLLEYRLSGSRDQMIQCFLDLQANAATVNYFSGVVAWDLRALAEHPGELPFAEELMDKGRDAVHLLFLPSTEGALQRHLARALPELLPIRAEPYTHRQLAQITLRQIEQTGIRLRQRDALEELMYQQVCASGVKTPRDVRTLARSAMLACQTSDSRLVLSADLLSAHISHASGG